MAGSGNERVELVSYSAQRVFGRLREASNEEQLRRHLIEARDEGWTVSFRGGQMAFDTHALNEDVVIQLVGFSRIGDVKDGKITVGANAPWGKILDKTRAQGHVPYVMISTEFATAGGTVSADCLSRFSPTCGKEGNHVESFRMMKLDGEILTCSRDANVELFQGVISGFGLMGVVLDVTYRLLKVPYENIVVKTAFTTFTGLRALAHELVTRVDEHNKRLRESNAAPTQIAALRSIEAEDAQAISAVVYMNKGRQGFVMHSSYVDGAKHPLKPSPFHQPKSLLQRALQVLAFFEITRVIGYLYILDFFLPRNPEAIDEVVGFTFFQGGNDAVRRAGRKLGFPMGIRQQTFVIPLVPDDPAGTKQKLGDFLEAADALLVSRGLTPPLIDVLYLPDDANEDFVLSSNHGISGYAVTITFEDPLRSDFPEEEAAYAALSEICGAAGGRVHLVKNVFARAVLLEDMYEWGVDRVTALKALHDPSRMLSNGFVRRVFPSLARATR